MRSAADRRACPSSGATGLGGLVALCRRFCRGNDKAKLKSTLLSVLAAICWYRARSRASGGASLHGSLSRIPLVTATEPKYCSNMTPWVWSAYSTGNRRHGFFKFPHTSLGRFKLRSRPKVSTPYSAGCLYPSDFAAPGPCSSSGSNRSRDRSQGLLTTDHRHTNS